MIEYKKTSSLSEIYEVDKTFFLRRIDDGVFQINKHFIKQGNTLRWNVSEIDSWWRNGEISIKDNILNKIL